MLRGESRLTRPAQYALVYREGRSLVSERLVLRWRPNSLGISRTGISVSRRVGGAVTRNRVKRRLRENMRRVRVTAGWDVVFLARPSAGTASYFQIGKSVTSLLSRAGILIG
ncbi:MAG: ribonuclease P protein component [Dehalococcoidia bacterium]|nr:MAG: ribonuclease P protein component [Dehalococcoidia bacterium]